MENHAYIDAHASRIGMQKRNKNDGDELG